MSNIFSILIATDCHLGYEESDRIIGEDSFVTFEEILIKAIEKEVDLVLLGGDLFHHNNPSQKCMNKCMELLRRYTLGNRPVYFELLCNASEVFNNSISQTTNYLDENINVSIPVFSIHGNHDDPSGMGQFSALDTLSSAGLVNYFGKWTNLEQVEIKPVLLRKGTTRIALYGLSHIKDDRLCRLFLEQKVKFIRPEHEPNEWFNIFVLHQNRANRGLKKFISESYIPEFMDLVIWGHEHDCLIEPVQNLEKGFFVIQPGSSVPTSLSEGESLEKHIALLKVYQKKMKITPLKLNTTRPFIWRSVGLWEIKVPTVDREKKSEEIKTHCLQIVEEMIRDAKKLLTGHTKQPKLPLVRLRCEYDDETQLFNVVKFGQLFLGRVANPNGEIIRLKRLVSRKVDKKEKFLDLARLNELYKEDMEEACNFSACVNHIVEDYFTNHEEAKMLVLRVKDMGAAVEKFIDKDDILAIEELVDHRLERLMKNLTSQKVNADETNLTELFKKLRNEEEELDLQEEKNLEKKLEELRPKGKESGLREGDEMDENNGGDVVGIEMDDDVLGRGREKGKKSRTTFVPDSDTDEYDVDEGVSKKQKGDLSDDSDSDMFGHQKSKGGSRKSKAEDEGSKGRGRRRERGRGRGRAKATESKRVSPRVSQSSPKAGRSRPPLKFGNSVLYDDDSD